MREDELRLIHARAAVRSFLTSPGRARLSALLDNPTAKNWGKVRLELCGRFGTFLDDRWTRSLSANESSSDEVASLLRAAKAPATCVIIGEEGQYDGEYPLSETLGLVGTTMVGMLISCVPGVPAFYQDETSDAYLLHRPRG